MGLWNILEYAHMAFRFRASGEAWSLCTNDGITTKLGPSARGSEPLISDQNAKAPLTPIKLATVGCCFGGKVTLDMARLGVDLDGRFSLNRNLILIQKANQEKVKAKVRMFIGASILLCLKGLDGPRRN